MKVVTKPWGWEKWVHEEDYVLKEIFMRAGYKSSKQYHVEKKECNLILSGTCKLRKGELTHTLGQGAMFTIWPGVVHRVEAITDLTMAELSTTEVDDVVRVEDDWHRKDGRIGSEHE